MIYLYNTQKISDESVDRLQPYLPASQQEKIAKKVSTKTNKIVEQIFKEALSDD